MAAELGDGAVGKNPSLFKCLDQLSGFTPIPGVPPRADGLVHTAADTLHDVKATEKLTRALQLED